MGKGEPTIGNNPKTIDKFTEMYIKIANAKPKQNNFGNELLDITPILTILKIITRYIIKSKIEPKNPNSSENNVKMKSVCFSGKKSK